MPYSSIEHLPPTFGPLPLGAKRIALEVVNRLLKEGEGEESAIRQAWGAVKKKYEKDSEGQWVMMSETEVMEFTHKREGGMIFPHSAYGYVPHRDRPSEWRYRLWESPEQRMTPKQVENAVKELMKTFDTLPRIVRPKVMARMRVAWRRTHPGNTWPKVLAMDEHTPTVVDVPNVQLFATGVWKGKPFGVEDLDGIVDAYNELPHLSRPVILGHDPAQPILSGSGMPAAGWVENLRRVGDKLYGDLKAVPSKVAELMQLGAFRKRSSEIYLNYTDSISGKTYPYVFKALALLGAVAPEVKTIDDIYALYSFDDEGLIVEFEEGELMEFELATISERGSFEWIKDQITKVFPEGTWVERVWPSYVLTSKGPDYFLSSWMMGPDGEVMLGSPQQVEREAFYTLATHNLEEGAGAAANSQSPTGEREVGGVEMSDEIRKKLLEVFELGEDATDEDILAAATKPPEAPTAEFDEGQIIETFKASEEYVELSARAEAHDQAVADKDAALLKYSELRRDTDIEAAMREGKITPAQKAAWLERYEKDPEMVMDILKDAPVVVQLGEEGKETDPSAKTTIDPVKVSAEVAELRKSKPELKLDEAYMEVLKRYEEV